MTKPYPSELCALHAIPKPCYRCRTGRDVTDEEEYAEDKRRDRTTGEQWDS